MGKYMGKILTSREAVNIYNTMNLAGYSFREICDYLTKKCHRGYDRGDSLCVIYYARSAVIITTTGIERVLRTRS